MALIDPNQAVRVGIPHEPGEWMRLRPIQAADIEALEDVQGQVRVSLELAAKLVLAWSYADPPTPENIRRLDLDTFLWLSKELLAQSGVRELAEKKGSGNSSSPGPDPAPVSSPHSLAT